MKILETQNWMMKVNIKILVMKIYITKLLIKKEILNLISSTLNLIWEINFIQVNSSTFPVKIYSFL